MEDAAEQVLTCVSRNTAETALWILAHAQAPQFSICAVLVGFQPYKSILWSCFAHSYKPYLFSWCCEVRVCWGRSLQSVTSCGLLSDSSSVDDIPLAVPTASCSHTCCWLFWCSSHVCASCFETLWWERAFLNLARWTEAVSASHHLSGAKEAVCECSRAGVVFACSVNFLPQIVGHFVKDILCWLAWCIKGLSAETLSSLLAFHFLLNSEKKVLRQADYQVEV